MNVFLMSTQMSTLKLIPHEPCWLLSGVSRCEGLDHVTVTVTGIALRKQARLTPLWSHQNSCLKWQARQWLEHGGVHRFRL
jgi:hypothetical protein